MLTPEQIEALPKEIKCVLQCAGRLVKKKGLRRMIFSTGPRVVG